MPAPPDRQPPLTDLPPPAIELVNQLLRRLQGTDDVPPLGKAERRMLFAATSFRHAAQALQRACELASRWHGTLYVLHVAGRGAAPRDDEANLARAALRGLRNAAARGRPDLLSRDQVMVRQGEFTRTVAATARELDAELVVLSGSEGQKGTAVARIARDVGVPVLVSRRRARSRLILAATDLADAGCCELRQAARFAHRLQAELAFLHNLAPFVHASSSALGHCTCAVVEPSECAQDECRGRLLALASYFGVPARTLVLTRPNAEDAIMQAAHTTAADMLVVGVRRHAWFERLFRTSLAARIVDRYEHSVLVTPLGIAAARTAATGPSA